MSKSIHHKVRTSQPQGFVGLSSVPLANGLVCAFTPVGRNYINQANKGTPGTNTGFTIQESAIVRYLGSSANICMNGGSYSRQTPFVYNRLNFPDPDITVASVFIPYVNGTAACTLLDAFGPAFERPSVVSLESGQLVAVQGQDTVSGKITHQNTPTYLAQNCAVYTNRHKSGSAYQALWLNGIKSSTTTTSVAQSNYAPYALQVGSNTTPAQSVGHFMSAAWDRILTDAEIKSLSDNPWQIFAPIEQPIFVGTTTTVVSITAIGDLAATEATVDTFAASGTASAQGSLVVTETSVDTFGSSGATLAQGSLAVTEAGVDTFAASGTAPAQGSLAVTEATPDTFGSSGITLAQGSLASTEATQDTFAASGSAPAQGTLAATDVTDTLAASGTAPAQGSLAVTETSIDTFGSAGVALIQGSLAVTEATVDTAAITGIAPVAGTGNLAATETSVDTLSISGVVLAQG